MRRSVFVPETGDDKSHFIPITYPNEKGADLSPLYFFARRSLGMRKPCAEHSISAPNLFWRVVSCLALMTHQMVCFFAEGGRD